MVPEQQPAQTVPSQTQPLAVQCRFGPQGLLPLQVQTPPLQASVVPGQLPQAAPFFPQLLTLCELKAMQLLPLQQPPQLFELHTQLPLRHCWPLAHWAPEPQRQVPSVAQVSASSAAQAVHALPPAPQLAAVAGLTQVVPLQHPDGQVEALHTQLPPWHAWPAPHGALLPHLHWPALQLSAVVVEHATQVWPSWPHSATVGGITQLLPLQQPSGQVTASQPSHTWLTQLLPPLQAAQLPPFFPHAVFIVPAWHTPLPSQQPFGQLVASHTQLPAEQRWPAPQTAPVPQAQAPLVHRSAPTPQPAHEVPAAPHAPSVSEPSATQVVPLQHPPGQLLALHTQAPPTQACPAAHAAPEPQVQLPCALHPSAVGPQAVQVAPLAPHCEALGVMHWPALQQPLGQLVASHTHWPDTQRSPVPHSAPLPHLHAPPAQVSALALQEAQAMPEGPQAAVLSGETQMLPLQHPVEQLVASQTQAPLWQRWPGPQAVPVPHLHRPPAQVSALLPHTAHDAPLEPHCEVLTVV